MSGVIHVLAVLAGVCAASSAGAGSVSFVNAAATGANTGASWADAFTSLQAAFAAAAPGSEIWVARGVYRPSESDAAATFAVPDGVAVYGGFRGIETEVGMRVSDPDPLAADPAFDTVLSGEIGVPGVSDNVQRVVTVTGAGPGTLLDRLTVVGAAGSSTGGGMGVSGSAVSVVGCSFLDNRANDGAGVFIAGGSPRFTACVFARNEAVIGRGGGAFARSSASPVFTGCRFEGNTAETGGGGAAFEQCEIALEGCVFEANTTACEGGGISLFWTTGSVRACSLQGNQCTGDLGSGAGGAVWGFGSDPVVERCVFGFNSAFQGGAVYFGGESEPLLMNCLVVFNSALVGGAASSEASQPEITNCTLAANAASGFVGGVFGAASIVNSVLRNTGQELSGAVVGYSLVEGGAPGAGNIDGVPQFVNEAGGEFSLEVTSPGIDAGSTPAANAGAFPLDAAGLPRLRDIAAVTDTGVGPGPIVDMGAFERQRPACPTDITGDGQTNTADLVLLLSKFGQSVPVGSAGDLTNDGAVNTADLVRLLSGFGTACA